MFYFHVNDVQVNALLDTGSEITVINFDVYNKMVPKPILKEKVKLNGISREVDIDAWLIKRIEISFGETKNIWSLYVAKIVEPCIIGIDFLCHFGAKLDFQNCTFTLNKEQRGIQQFKNEMGDCFDIFPVIIDKKIVIPPNSVARLLVRASLPDRIFAVHGVNNMGLLVPNTLVAGRSHIPIQLINDQDRYVKFKQGHIIGHAIECDVMSGVADSESLHQVKVITSSGNPSKQADELPEHLTGLFTRSKGNLSESEQVQLKSLLLEFQHIFSKGIGDLGCFSEIKHKLILVMRNL